MNREIKFRGIREEYNPAWHQSIFRFGNLLNNNSIGEVGYDLSHYEYARVNPETIGQFTGLLDKNGNEIYEGDLLCIGADEFGFITTDNGETVKYEVRFEGCNYILYRSDLKLNWGRLSRLDELNWNCQVVGNIYETVAA